MRLLIVSPHLDDAVLGCGRLLAQHPGAIVLTVFAGVPANAAVTTEWDTTSGFGDAGEAIAARREEDRRALEALGAVPHWLDYCDAQYGQTPLCSAVASSLHRSLQGYDVDTVLGPLGLFHSDHLLAAEALLEARRADRCGRRWLTYEDALYRRFDGLLQQRLAQLQQRGIQATPQELPQGSQQAKRRAVGRYRSQLRALGSSGRPGHGDAFAPERYWRLDDAAHDTP
jgi:LmbE family N-acetylglucosaminyl deacetylase